jgi:hypothetical protein
MDPKYRANDIFREHCKGYLEHNKVPTHHLRVINALIKCRTSALGEHWEKCDNCSATKVHYNSCGNRHCPSCQGVNRERWILERSYDLFNVKHFHVTFTIPFELRELFRFNKKILFNLLFRCVKETLLSFGQDKRSRLEAKIGVIAILHTWTQQMEFHPHIHCIVPGGGLTNTGEWKPVKRKKYLFCVKAMSNVFKEKFCGHLKKLYNQLHMPQNMPAIKNKAQFDCFVNTIKEKGWVVNSKPSFNGSQQVLEYLGRYTHKIAIGNYRLKNVTKTHVTFSYLDRRDGDKQKLKTLKIDKFIGRFLQHILPARLVKIRHYGYFAARVKKKRIKQIKESLGEKVIERGERPSLEKVLLQTKGIDVKKCSCCKVGNMIVFKVIHPTRGSPRKMPMGKSFE